MSLIAHVKGFIIYPDINDSLKSLKSVNLRYYFQVCLVEGIFMTIEWNMARERYEPGANYVAT